MQTVVRRARIALDRDGWGHAFGISALIFLTLMAAGAALLVAGKLQFPSLGSGAGPLDILRAIGLVGLACLGATVDIDDLPLSVIPLGALGAVAWSSTRLARDAFSERPAWGPIDVFKVGAAFALMMFVAALVFRFGGSVPVSVSPWEALGLGFVWGSALAALGALLVRPRVLKRSMRWAPNEVTIRSLRLSAQVARFAVVGTVIALLCVVIARLARSPLPRSFGVGDALAAIIYLIAFLPNALVALFSLAAGATLTIGAQVGAGGDVVGPMREHSLFEWGRGDPPIALLLLILLPLVVSVAGGMVAAERDRDLRSLAVTIAGSAAILALGVLALAAVGDARLGAGLVRQRGVGLVAVNAAQAGALTFLWLCAGGALGVAIHRRLQAR